MDKSTQNFDLALNGPPQVGGGIGPPQISRLLDWIPSFQKKKEKEKDRRLEVHLD